MVLTATCGLLTLGGACLTFVQAQQTRETTSDLTLANIEALAGFNNEKDGIWIDGDFYTGDMSGRSDCQANANSGCGMTVSTPSGGYVEYVQGATQRPGWAS